MRRALVSHGFLITHGLFSLYHRLFSQVAHRNTQLTQSLLSPLARYLTTVFTFLVSALMHVLACPRIELEMVKPQLWVHLGTAAAIVLEDILIASYAFLQMKWSEITSNSDSKEKLTRLAKEGTEALSTGHHLGTAPRSRRPGMASSPIQSLGDHAKKQRQEVSRVGGTTSKTPSLAWRVVGYTWVGAFWTVSISNLMYAIYNS